MACSHRKPGTKFEIQILPSYILQTESSFLISIYTENFDKINNQYFYEDICRQQLTSC